eukprot:TRINITY_DN19561_c0_g1_i1.p3 TRINITY_DN19561_c0_g1~~TRINITY_DN19561_c0_g1_i1.p3  ORF type:complete len:103 (-),score=1.30 TRINITY_DN19561_c0_g1_i1:44-352(-)
MPLVAAEIPRREFKEHASAGLMSDLAFSPNRLVMSLLGVCLLRLSLGSSSSVVSAVSVSLSQVSVFDFVVVPKHLSLHAGLTGANLANCWLVAPELPHPIAR